MCKKLNPEVMEMLFTKIAAGDSLRSLLQSIGVEPIQFSTELNSDPEYIQRYIHARRTRTELHVDEMIEIADTEPDPQKARVRIETRRWIASKMNPTTYGDRLDLNVNQTVDIGSALQEARSRAQLLDASRDVSPDNTGLEPVAVMPPKNEEVDPFS